ncbi:MAG: glycine--tRNA ligase [Candidatus Marsarchaeota archaeon]|nr:glycine--tRNA ligase [Candidatus Marsarchaeota archaeon]
MNIDDLLAYAKAKGFFWPSAEIYGSTGGILDYGHLGALLKRRFENLWIRYFVDSGDEYHLIDGSSILPEKALVASGHASRFNDVLVGCSKCHTYYRADVLLTDSGIKVSEGATTQEIDNDIKGHNVVCPKDKGALLPSKAFNMMIDVNLGPDKTDKAYLRPETAQSAYLNFFREFNSLRKTLPLGLALIGKAYRNEISPRQGLYRMRELTQAELQIFFDPSTWKPDTGEFKDVKMNVVPYSTKKMESSTQGELVSRYNIPEFYAYHMAYIHNFYTKVIGVPEEKFRFLEKGGDEKAFYNKVHMDIEIDIASWNGFKEVGGLHYRGDYDLTCHTKGSNQDLSVSIDGKRIMPNVLELSFGVDRNVWMLIDVFYKKDGERTVLGIPHVLAPYKIAVFPLQKDEAINKKVDDIYKELKKTYKVVTDTSGSIGRRYARMDDIGTPYCITVDFDTVDSNSQNYGSVTVRDRNTKEQERIKEEDLFDYFADHL